MGLLGLCELAVFKLVGRQNIETWSIIAIMISFVLSHDDVFQLFFLGELQVICQSQKLGVELHIFHHL